MFVTVLGENLNMKNIIRALAFLFLLLVLILPELQAKTTVAEKKPLLSVVFAVYRPPYIFETKLQGLDFEITKAAMDAIGYNLKALNAPNTRALQEMKMRKVDAVAGVSPDFEAGLCYSEPILIYSNVVITKKKHNIKIDSLEDLKKIPFMAFQSSRDYLGEEYKKQMSGNKNMREIASQQEQSKLFWSDKEKVIVTDLNVFNWYKNNLPDIDTKDEFVVHRIFETGNAQKRVVAFRSEKYCHEFNKGLRQIKANGDYQKILDKYLVVMPK